MSHHEKVHQGVLEPNAVILWVKTVGLKILAFSESSHYHHYELSSKVIVFLIYTVTSPQQF